MEKKIIALGNMLMCDNSIGIKLAECLCRDFKSLGFEIILGETNINYCLDKIKNRDFIVILDSSCQGIAPGTITLTNINNIDINKPETSQYALELVKLLNLKQIKVSGFLLTIEICEIYCNLDLSPTLNSKFHSICNECIQLIKKHLN